MTSKKTALVTGANAGMGKATAITLAKLGMEVVMLCRSPARGEAALQEVKEKSGSSNVSLMMCDLSDMADIQRFCKAFMKQHPVLDVLVNNAGVLSFERQETKDGLELHFGICHVGHFLLTMSLLPCMGKSSRIVMVGSVAHKAGRIDFDDLGMKAGYSVARAYSRAKLCNLLFTKELARRLYGTGITVNCVHPGAVVTSIGARRENGKDGNTALRRAAGRLLGFFVRTPEKGAATAVYVATSSECENITGAYFANCKIAKPARRAEDLPLAQKLWAVTEELTKAFG